MTTFQPSQVGQLSNVYEPYRVTVQQYVNFREQGFLVVKNLVPLADVEEMLEHMDDLLAGREQIPGVERPAHRLNPDEQIQYWLRVHMLHQLLPIHERFLLHPRVLDVLEAIIGPDVLALQSMLFFKQPGQPGQGYHQDSYYIPTFPDSLCGAWLALDRADEENGCLWITVGSQHEPIYPDRAGKAYGQREISDIEPISYASHTNEEKNGLTKIARKYAGKEVKVEVDPGDVVFFGGHILHRSHSNRSQTRSRRAFVGHYCNARSWTPWQSGGKEPNGAHILARGTSHLPYAQPKFGTPCAANAPRPASSHADQQMSMMGDDGDMMTMMAHETGDHMH